MVPRSSPPTALATRVRDEEGVAEGALHVLEPSLQRVVEEDRPTRRGAEQVGDGVTDELAAAVEVPAHLPAFGHGRDVAGLGHVPERDGVGPHRRQGGVEGPGGLGQASLGERVVGELDAAGQATGWRVSAIQVSTKPCAEPSTDEASAMLNTTDHGSR